MNRKFIVAILLVAAVPVCAQAQSPSVPRVSKGDAQKVVVIISGDKAKTQAYCDIRKLSEQIEEASAKKDSKTVEELWLKIETLEKTLGPEYVALIDGLDDIVGNDLLGAEFMSALASLDRLCTR
jgi:peptidoglycan hydrolase CwlO-like protein